MWNSLSFLKGESCLKEKGINRFWDTTNKVLPESYFFRFLLI